MACWTLYLNGLQLGYVCMYETLDSNTNVAETGGKRVTEEYVTTENGNEVDEVENSVEEQRMEKKVTKIDPVSVGYKYFKESVKMYDYFFKPLHYWPSTLNVSKFCGEVPMVVLMHFCKIKLVVDEFLRG